MQGLGIDNSFFQKLRNDKSTNFINAEDLDRQFTFVKTFINTVLTPAINELTNGEIADDGGQNPLNKFLFNNNNGEVLWAGLDSNFIPDGYLSYSAFEQGPAGSVLAANNDGIFSFLTPAQANQILLINDDGISWGTIDNTYLTAGFADNNKLTGDKFVRRTLKEEHIRPGTLTPNIPDEIARTPKISNGAVTGPKILPGSLELRNFGVSASFPFPRLYNIITPDHFADNAISSGIIQDNSIDLSNFINYRWNVNTLEYLRLGNYLEQIQTPSIINIMTQADFEIVKNTPNAYYFYYYKPYTSQGGNPPLNPRFPVTYYFPRLLVHNFVNGNRDDAGLFINPISIPEVLTRFKYKYITLGKLKNKTVKEVNFQIPNNFAPARVALNFFYAAIKPSNVGSFSVGLKTEIRPYSSLVVNSGEQSSLNAFDSFRYANEGASFYNNRIGNFKDYFLSWANAQPVVSIDHTYWCGGRLLPNYSRYPNSGITDVNNPNNILRLRSTHIAPGTIGKRHFLPQDLAIMKAAADAKFNG